MTLGQIAKFILEGKKIGITYHVSPDGDAVGSVLALFNALKSLNKDCYIISKDTLSENLKFLKKCLTKCFGLDIIIKSLGHDDGLANRSLKTEQW